MPIKNPKKLTQAELEAIAKAIFDKPDEDEVVVGSDNEDEKKRFFIVTTIRTPSRKAKIIKILIIIMGTSRNPSKSQL